MRVKILEAEILNSGKKIINKTFFLLEEYFIGDTTDILRVKSDGTEFQKGIYSISVNKNNYIIEGKEEKKKFIASNYNEDEQKIVNLINSRFEMMDVLLKSIIDNITKGCIIYGAPGCGKSFGVDKALNNSGRPFIILKGKITASSLYKTLYEENGKIIVFDDCDNIFDDENSLNILKAGLDTSEKRIITWKINRKTSLPTSFEFTGQIIFITNKNLEKIHTQYKNSLADGKKISANSEHISAILSRVDYLDLMLETNEQIYLRIDYIVRNTGMLLDKDFSESEINDILDYLKNNLNNLRELSLRTVLKISNYLKMEKQNWKEQANIFLLRN